MYKLIKGFQNNIGLIKYNQDGSFMAIPFDPANTDYANFCKEILADEAQLQDAEGVIMADAKAYVKELP